MALEIHVRGVEKVLRQEIGFSFFCSILAAIDKFAAYFRPTVVVH